MSQTNRPDYAEIKKAANEFYQALNQLFSGNVAAMEAVWSHAADVSYLGPQGDILIGWDQVHKEWKEQAAMVLGGHVEPQEMHIIANQEIGIAYNEEIGTNNVHGKPYKIKIRATNLFRKENGKWKMIGHHTDLLPFLHDD